MGKNLRQQRRGKGTPAYRNPGHRQIGKVRYPMQPAGVISDIVDAPGRTNPVALVRAADGSTFMNIAHSGAFVGQSLLPAAAGGVVEVGSVQEGVKVFNIENRPGDGGKLCRASGAAATVVSHDGKNTLILMPSKKKKKLSSRCRVTVGSAAGEGRREKPFMKAGSRFFARRARNLLYPRVSGVSMNAVDHPFGGSAKPGKHKSVSRDMPPGKKVGSISPRRMGKRKSK